MLTRLRAKLSEVGPGYFLDLGYRRLLPAHVLGRSRSLLLALQTRPSKTVPQVRLPVRWGCEQDLGLIQEFGHPESEIQFRLAGGDRVCVLDHGGRLQAYAWFTTGKRDEMDLRTRFRLASSDAWLYDAMVAPQLRGQGLYPRFLAASAALLGVAGVDRILIQVETLNRNSVKAHLAGGAVSLGELSALHLLGFARVHDRIHDERVWLRPREWYEFDVTT